MITPYRDRIDSLTPEEMAQTGPWAERWIERAIDTSPPDWDRWERGVRACYKHAGAEWPKVVLRVRNPVEGAVAAAIARALLYRGTRKLSKTLVKLAHAEIAASGCNRAESDDITDGVTEAVNRILAAHRTLPASDKDAKIEWHPWYAGRLWYSWQAYTSFVREVLGLRLPGDLWQRDADYADAECSGYWWPNRCFLISCPPANRIRLERIAATGEQTRRMHSEDGPGVGWDGWALYAWHGVIVPRRVILEPDKITLADIKAEANAEVRRVMRERYGDGRYLNDIKAKLVDADYEGVPVGAAPRCLLEDDEGARWLVGTDGGTGRVYHMLVGMEPKTCKAAHELLACFPEDRIKCKS